MWNALLAGACGSKGCNAAPCRNHAELVKRLRGFALAYPEKLRRVRWNTRPLSDQEVSDIQQEMKQLTIGEGYLTSACDAALVTFAAAFRVCVLHEYVGSQQLFEVDAPVGIVLLCSSIGHMAHQANLPPHEGHLDRARRQVLEAEARAAAAVAARASLEDVHPSKHGALERSHVYSTLGDANVENGFEMLLDGEGASCSALRVPCSPHGERQVESEQHLVALRLECAASGTGAIVRVASPCEGESERIVACEVTDAV